MLSEFSVLKPVKLACRSICRIFNFGWLRVSFQGAIFDASSI
jgi:hypothetical protein